MRNNTIWLVEFKAPKTKYWTSGINFFYWTREHAQQTLKENIERAKYTSYNPYVPESAKGTKWRISAYKKK